MELAVKNTIEADSIVLIKVLDGSQANVFQLVGDNNDSIVVKMEKADAITIKTQTPAIKAIAPNAATKICKTEDLAAILEYCRRYTAGELPMLLLVNHPANAELTQAVALVQARINGSRGNASRTFIKMALANVADLGRDFILYKDAGDKSGLRSFVRALNESGGLERLGEIIACDLVNQNYDRIWPGGGTSMILEGLDGEFKSFNLHLKCVANITNIFRAGNSKEIAPLDFLNAGAGWTDWTKPLKETEGTSHQEWGGRVLADRRRRVEFSKDVAEDLEKILQPAVKRPAFGKKKYKLDPNAATRLDDGMLKGAIRIRRHLHQKLIKPAGQFQGPTNPLQGLIDRIKRIKILDTMVGISS